MKKIITALTVTALTLSAVFAEVSVEYTQGAYLYSPKGNKMMYNGYKANEGLLTFNASNDNVGVKLALKPVIGANEADGYDEKTTASKLDTYTGWVNFGSGLFKLQSGVWDERSVNRFVDNAGKWTAPEYERYKLGVANGKIAGDINNLPTVNGTKALSSVLSFANDGVFVKAALITNAYGTLDLKSGFGFEAGAKIGEGTSIIADLKTTANKEVAFGIFAENKSLKENLDFLVGWSFGGKNANGTRDGSFETAIDLRANYVLNDQMDITTMNNFTYTSDAKDFSVWDMVSLGIKATDKILAMVTVEWEYAGLEKSHAGTLDIIPSVKYTAAKGVDVSAGLVIQTTGWSRPSGADFSIPFLLHVAL